MDAHVCAQVGQEDEEVRVEDAAEQASNLLGMQFTRLIASSGFQLINVNNVAIELKVRTCASRCCSAMDCMSSAGNGSVSVGEGPGQ